MQRSNFSKSNLAVLVRATSQSSSSFRESRSQSRKQLLDTVLDRNHRVSQSTRESEYQDLVPSTPESKQSRSTQSHITSEQTPLKQGTNRTASPLPTIKEMQPVLRAELKGCILDADRSYHRNVFKSVIDEADVQMFLSRTGFYKNGKWKDITNAINRATKQGHNLNESDLYAPFMKILKAIFKFFKYPNHGRRIVDTHNIKIPHTDYHGVAVVNLQTSPDFLVMGSGSNFHAAKTKPECAGYDHCASPGEIKTEENQSKEENSIQVAVYARQCFLQQHHRRYVYSVILTEKFATLYQYDRSGALRSVRFNIHENPEDFVRIILGFGSPNAAAIGFDTSVFWRGNKRYIIINNQWEGHDPGEQEYELAESAVAFSRKALRGRGTVCWNALDSEENIILIKDSWRSVGREPEYKFLMEVEGLDGVGQMLAYQDIETDTISNFRNVDGSTLPKNEDRIFSRIALKAYGKPIEYFDSLLDLLYVFRDAVNGHRNLLMERRILHRDVSLNNILHGKDKIRPGNRGLLIDLDMAIHIDRTSSLAGITHRTGTRAFQSYMVLKSGSFGDWAPPHDYLDDLESFFYVLGWICLIYTGPNQRRAEPEDLVLWEDENLRTAALNKYDFLKYPDSSITPYFQPLTRLLQSLSNFLITQVDRKERAARTKQPRVPLTSIMSPAEKHYEIYLSIIDETIATLAFRSSNTVPGSPLDPNRSQHASKEPLTPTATSPFSNIRTPGSARKRRTDDELVSDSPSAKRSRAADVLPPPPESPSGKENRKIGLRRSLRHIRKDSI